ncbi:Ser/Thr protein phosphatase superfamily [Penicillium digitatum PHI26]|uniref:Ser/Thr protein phosphatase superfamily n=3 Tax=Penicillium digitatum TaxID=36651 RepID=K9GAN2_PEND2|nr:Ser/Thr protein phosphatase superfamily [Penicillium digitatum Pd1]EKV09095.1 Ser/Thr protein phosphatase superfamily [Penicillium digitatum Pd1]EKV10361.1 Ser/Thr protein phosphatase superfamily [Penicillium digitatum PHI26]
MSTFQILSDLHLENPSAYDVFSVSPKAPYLALLGDIGVVKDAGFTTFIETQLRQFQIVFFLLGNHEPYHSTWEETKQVLRLFSASVNHQRSTSEQDEHSKTMGSFIFLDQTRYDLSPNVTILGCTLFSRVSEADKEHVSYGLNDFYHIKDWTVDNHTAAHEADLRWLNGQVSHIAASEPHRKIVVFTHHGPVTQDPRALDPRHVNSSLSSGFASDLSGQEIWKSPLVKLWAFGHTHFNFSYIEAGTEKMVVSNQRGYYFSQAHGFDGELVVEV